MKFLSTGKSLLNRLNQLTFWAKRNPGKARWTIFLLHGLISLCGVFVGILLSEFLPVPGKSYYLFPISMGLLAILFYPRKRRGGPQNRRKVAEAVLLVCGIWIWVGVGLRSGVMTGESVIEAPGWFSVQDLSATRLPEGKQAQERPIRSSHTAKQEISTFPKSFNTQSPPRPHTSDQVVNLSTSQLSDAHEKETLRESRPLKKEFRKRKPLDTGVKVGLMVLTVVVALALSVGIMFLGCAVICSGSVVLGVLIWIFGITGVIIGAFLVGVRIFRGKRRRRSSEPAVP